MEFAASQIWKILDGQYSGVEIYIHKVLLHDVIGKIFHISVPSQGVSHMPFSSKAIMQSKLEFVRLDHDLGSEWEEGFNIWHEAFQKNDAGVFSIPITEAINLIFVTRDDGEDCESIN